MADLVGPWEHRSYLLPWREAGATVATGATADPRTGRADLGHRAQVTMLDCVLVDACSQMLKG